MAKYTNQQMSKKESFVRVCEEAGIKPTSRQVSKLRNKKGALWNYLRLRKGGEKIE